MKEYPYDGVISAESVYEAFWKAAEKIDEDNLGIEHPYLDREMNMIDTSGGGMPQRFWEHMARALSEDE